MLSYTAVLVICFNAQWVNAFHEYKYGSYADQLDDYLNRKIIKSKEVKNILLQVDRKHYTPSHPYENIPVIIGHGGTFSTTKMQATVLEALKGHLKEGSRVLDVGCSSGYLSVCFALMVNKTGLVVAIDHMKGLVAYAIKCTKKDKPHLLEEQRINFTVGDGRLGVPEYAPYDAINIGAICVEIPEALLQQLKEGGRLVAPVHKLVGGFYCVVFTIVDKDSNGNVTITERKPFFMDHTSDFLTTKEQQFPKHFNQFQVPNYLEVEDD